MNNAGFLTIDDLYKLSEEEVINKILNCEDTYLSESFKKFMNTDKVYSSLEPITDKYCVYIKSKIRYINPLVKTELGTKRITEISEKTKHKIINFLNLPKITYIYFDFDFKPYEEMKQKSYKKK